MKQDIKDFIKESVKKIQLQEQLDVINNQLNILKEGENEEPEYAKNTYKDYESDLEKIVSLLSEASQILESGILKQESFINKMPDVPARKETATSSKKTLIDIFKDVKSAKISTQRKIY